MVSSVQQSPLGFCSKAWYVGVQKGWVTKVINCGVGDAFVFTKTRWIKGDRGSDSLSLMTRQKMVQFLNVPEERKAKTVTYTLTDVA